VTLKGNLSTTRVLSWIFAALACVAPPVWMAFATQAYSLQHMDQRCGLWVFSYFYMAGLMSIALCLIATGFTAASFRSENKPLSLGRVIESLFITGTLAATSWFLISDVIENYMK
jgi:hypothetical protein